MEIEELTSFTDDELNDLAVLMHQLTEGLTVSRERLERVLADPSVHTCVVRDGSRIVACANLCIHEVPSGLKGCVEDVVVLKEYRGRHLGRMLLEHIIAMAGGIAAAEGPATAGQPVVDGRPAADGKSASIELQLTSKPHRIAANALYRSLGFKQVETNCYRMDISSHNALR